MSQRVFQTSEVLATIHGFPAIIAARHKCGIIEAFDRLRAVSPQMAGIEHGQGHLEWCALGDAMKDALAEHFPQLAEEPIPSTEYWGSNMRAIDPDKVAELGAWVLSLEQRYGQTLAVPDISATVTQKLQATTVQPKAVLYVLKL